MSSEQLHPSVAEFKEFTTKYPKLIKHVREEGKGWQSYYEKWVLLGEEDSYWTQFEESTSNESDETSTKSEDDGQKSKDNKEMMSQFMGMVENVDLNKVQGHIQQLNGAISNIQQLVGQFQEMKKSTSSQKQNTSNRSPFGFGRD